MKRPFYFLSPYPIPFSSSARTLTLSAIPGNRLISRTSQEQVRLILSRGTRSVARLTERCEVVQLQLKEGDPLFSPMLVCVEPQRELNQIPHLCYD